MTNKTLIATALAVSLGLAAEATVAKPAKAERTMPTFAELDSNQDGALTQAELEAHHAARFAAVDANGDGKLSAAELETYRAAQRQEMTQEKLAKRSARVIERFDTDGDGALSAAEMPQRRYGTKMFARADADGNGALSVEEFEAARAKLEKRMKGKFKQRQDGASQNEG